MSHEGGGSVSEAPERSGGTAAGCNGDTSDVNKRIDQLEAKQQYLETLDQKNVKNNLFVTGILDDDEMK